MTYANREIINEELINENLNVKFDEKRIDDIYIYISTVNIWK